MTEAEELRTKTSRLLKQKLPHNTPNITKEEYRAIKELREDQPGIVLTADKGVAMVIMDRQQYMDKATILLQDTNTYRTIPKDPTNKQKNKLIGILKDIKQTGGLKDTTYCKVYPTSAIPPKFYGLPKIHKVGTPLRPIMSSRLSITYGVCQGAGRYHTSTSRPVTTPS